MTDRRIFLDIHAIQTVPPSNINRDDTGTPKIAQYGGVTRARVSSQSWKKAMREYFAEQGGQEIGKRSKKIPQYIADKIREKNSSIEEEKALELAHKVLNAAGVSTDEKKNEVKALFFISPEQAEEMAKAAIEGLTDKKDKKELQTRLNNAPALDIVLFGRMVADDPTLNADASAQVAHAISTHAVQTEFDFFTATDDISHEDSAGAGMLGTIEFNSSTLYRYANVAIHELKKQMASHEDPKALAETLKLFVEAFVKSMPTGKSNTFANQTLPQALVVTLRGDRPVNLVSAFETPVKTSGGYLTESINKLKEEFKNEKFADKPLLTLTVGAEGIGEELPDFNSLTAKFEEALMNLLSK
ncbi:MAG: type I-E CRISPR-associated protein Cas7/Cse4/CasC [Candidatus Riflebacteria bacterium]|nr:type I-E CRISPR-associated protein Cas7/Cse4/CasC [Candidatus Riflebacteria bacterium]